MAHNRGFGVRMHTNDALSTTCLYKARLTINHIHNTVSEREREKEHKYILWQHYIARTDRAWVFSRNGLCAPRYVYIICAFVRGFILYKAGTAGGLIVTSIRLARNITRARASITCSQSVVYTVHIHIFV